MTELLFIKKIQRKGAKNAMIVVLSLFLTSESMK